MLSMSSTPSGLSMSSKNGISTQTINQIKKKYEKYGIYLYPCNKCDQVTQALHIEHCFNPQCKTLNLYYQKPEI